MSAKPKPLEVRFWAKVRKGHNGCWEWTASLRAGDYGQIGLGARGSGHSAAHRLSWELHNGPIPPGLSVLHKCDNRLCVRPDHLFLGTQADNMRDMARKGRSPTGERHGSAKLTDDKVVAIRAMAKTNAELSHAKIAEYFGIKRQNVGAILSGKIWRNIS